MNILALEPYYGGSHKYFIDNWIKYSRHNFDLLTLPANKWKWRMRHSSITFANKSKELLESGKTWDVIFASDMINLAEYKGLCCLQLKKLPTVLYFHENQLTYPNRYDNERDMHFGFTNIISAHAAGSVWFNTVWHRTEFISAAKNMIKKMPDNLINDLPEKVLGKSVIHYPGIEKPEPKKKKSGFLRILWVARWEHDKNPELFFDAILKLKVKGLDFRISVLGESFSGVPDIFVKAKDLFADNIDYWGYQKSRGDYFDALSQADIVVSTAEHEFFGISVAEAIAAGCIPLLPERLAYPELIGLEKNKEHRRFFYDCSLKSLTEKLEFFIKEKSENEILEQLPSLSKVISSYYWEKRAAEMDAEIDLIEG